MASTKMFTKNHHGPNASSTSFFHQQQQHPPPPASSSSAAMNQPFDEDITLTQEMHVKMAKKIAQLTKVIYTLNTKADEHETIVSNLKQAFEQEKSALAKNASSKIDDLQRRVEKLSSVQSSHNASYQNKIQLLESERQNQANELLRIQQSSVEREHHLAEDFREKISSLKKEIHQVKKIYDERVVRLNHEHEEILTKLREEHQLEIENVKKELQDLFHIENEAQTKFYLQKIDELKREHQELLLKEINQNELGEEFLREKQRLEEQIQSLRNDIEQIEQRSQLALQEQYELLENKSNEYQQLSDDFEQYKSVFNTKSSNLNEMNEQLTKQRHEYEQLKQKFEKSNREMNTVKERFNRQAMELEEKLKLLKDKDAINRQLENDLIDSRKELQLTRDRLQQIETDQHAQLTESESTTNYLERRIHELDKTIHQLTLEKQQLMLKYDRELTDLRDTYENQVMLCKKEMQNELDRLSEHYQQLSNDEQTRAQTKLQSKEQELRQQFELEKNELLARWKNDVNQSKSEQNEFTQQLNQMKDDYSKQIEQLKKRYEDKEQDFIEIEKQYHDVQIINSERQKQLEEFHVDLTKQRQTSEQYQFECEQLKKRYEELERNSTKQLQDKIEQLTNDLNEKWTKKLKFDCEKIRKDLLQQKDDEKQRAIDELQKQKQNHVTSAQRQIEELEHEIRQLRNQLENEQQKSKEESLLALQNANEDKRRTMNEFQMRIQDLNNQIQRLESKYQEDILTQKLQLEKEHLNQINELKNRHMEDIRGQQLAYNTHLDTIRVDHERALTVEIDKQTMYNQNNLEQLRKELTRNHANELEDKERAFSKELAAVRLQLDRALEITKIKEREADLRIEDLTSDLTTKQTRIDHCLRDLNELQDQMERLREEIDLRSRETQRVRNDTQKEIKHREEKLRQENEDKLRELTRFHENEQKQLLEEFSKAHELLKSRVSELQSKLHEAEERYRNRESRTEDLELISTLQQTIASYQEQLKKIHDEKKYLKMELVNRETNYNKVFSNAPSSNIGVINPLAYNTKFVPRTSDTSSTATVSTRLKSQSPRPSKLEPLMTNGEIPHDLTLNPNKPLLPKRFLK